MPERNATGRTAADGPEDTALGEALHEIEDAETRTPEPGDERHRQGEAADAITPNTEAQEQSEGD